MPAIDRDQLKSQILEDKYCYSAANPRLDRIDQGRAAFPADPFFLWAELNELRYFTNPEAKGEWIEAAVGRGRLEKALQVALTAVHEPEDRGGEHLALYRLAHLLQGEWLLKADANPSAQVLAEVRRHAEAYSQTRSLDFLPLEDDTPPGWLFREIRAGAEAHELAGKATRTPADFLPLFEYLADFPSLIQGHADVALVLPDFQAWAVSELRSRKATKPLEELVSDYSLHTCSLPKKQLEEVVAGRTLAMLLVGFADPDRLVSTLIKDDRAKALAAMLAGGLPPDACDSDDGTTNLHYAVECGAVGCIAALVAAGADPKRKNDAGKTPLGLAKGKPKLLAALDQASSATLPTLDLSKLAKAVQAIPKGTLTRFACEFGESDPGQAMAEKVEKILAAAPSSWDELVDGPLARGLPWEALALALAVQRLGVEAPAGEVTGDEPRFIPGDLTLEGPLELKAPLVVAGDLTVKGPVIDHAPEGRLIVAGTLVATSLITEGDLLLGGDCLISEVVWGDYNDFQLLVGGTLRAPLILATDHAIEAKRVEGELLESPDAATMAARVSAEVLEGKSLDRKKVIRCVKAGEGWLAAGAGKPKKQR